jgi:hypothetical protein
MTWIKRPCRCPVCKVPSEERAARLEEAMRPERERQQALERARRDRYNAKRRAKRALARNAAIRRRKGGSFSVEVDGLVYLYETADAALDALLDWRQSGKRPHGWILAEDPPEGVRP